MTDITIPPEARLAATQAYLDTGGCIVSTIRAALKAWPLSRIDGELSDEMCLILPLPQEKTDGK